jgi:hypothetical protein
MTRLVLEPAVPVGAVLALLLAGCAVLAGYQLVGPPPPATPRCRAVSASATFVGFAALVALLLNPTWLELIPPPSGRPALHVLVDTSASMAATDAGARGAASDGVVTGDRSRIDAARALARRVALELGGSGERALDVRLHAFDGRVRPIALEALDGLVAAGEVTDLAGAIRRVLDEPRPGLAAVLVLSDGIHTATGGTDDLAAAARAARALGVPVHASPFGGDVAVVDVGVELDAAEEVAFAGQDLTVAVRVVHQGFDRGSALATLSSGGGRPVASRPVDLATRSPVEVAFTLEAREPGTTEYTVSVAPLSGELVLANNSRDMTLRVIDEQIRVLVLEGKPYWDLKFLTRALMRDPALVTTTAVRLTPQRALVRTRAERAPARAGAEGAGPGGGSGAAAAAGAGAAAPPAESVRTIVSESGTFEQLLDGGFLDRQHVVVLGRDAETFLAPVVAERVRSWVSRRGGALLCARGRPGALADGPLEPLLPVRWEPPGSAAGATGPTDFRFGLEFTEQGRGLQLLPRRLLEPLTRSTAGLSTEARARDEKDLATVLARAVGPGPDGPAGMPALTVQPYGLGRVIALEGAGMWRLAFSPAGRADQEALYRSLWAGLLRWVVAGGELMPGQRASLRPARASFTTLEPVVLSVVSGPDAPFGPRSLPVVELARPDGAVGRHAAVPTGTDARLYRVSVGPLPAGRYRARLPVPGGRPADCSFSVAVPLAERLQLGARPDQLALLAEQTGGSVLTRPDPASVRDACSRYWTAAHPTRYARTPAWDNVMVLALVVGAWAVAWLVRRRGGLV